MTQSRAKPADIRRLDIVSAGVRNIQLTGLDPAPIGLVLVEPMSDEALFAAAGMPPSRFVETLKPYRVLRHSAVSYELVLGPEGYGAELLAALRWLGSVAAAGILASLSCEKTCTYVTLTLEGDKLEWKYEELTEHGDTFLADRYRRFREDAVYQQGLEGLRHHETLAQLGADMRRKVSDER
jgi:hypothetical protein